MTNHPLLSRYHPQAKLIAYCGLGVIFMSHPVTSGGWRLAFLLVVVAWWRSGDRRLHALLKMRWLLLAIVAIHALFSPGTPLFSWLPLVTREGVVTGGVQTLRLILLFTLSQLLIATTPPRLLMAGVVGSGKWTPQFVQRGATLVVLVLDRLPRLWDHAARLREELALRLGHPRTHRERLLRLSSAGTALLLHLLREVRVQEEILRCRGLERVPVTYPPLPPWSGQDQLLVAAILLPWLGNYLANLLW